MRKGLHPWDDIGTLYMSRKGGIGLFNSVDYKDATFLRMRGILKKE